MPKPPKRDARKAAAATRDAAPASSSSAGLPSASPSAANPSAADPSSANPSAANPPAADPSLVDPAAAADATRRKAAAKKVAVKEIGARETGPDRDAGTSGKKKVGIKKVGPKKVGTKKIGAKKTGTKKIGGATKSTAKKTVRRAVRSGSAVLRTATLDGATASVLDRLFEVVTSRRDADPNISHSARLLSRGTAKVAQKFGEEAVECLIEAVAGNSAKLIGESADVLYHLIVMWVDAGVHPHEIWAELQRREGTSGIAEKMSRGAAARPTGE